jgi:hypothetical protein
MYVILLHATNQFVVKRVVRTYISVKALQIWIPMYVLP